MEANKSVVYKHQNLSQPSTIIQLEGVYISLGLQLKYYIFLGFIYAILLKLSCWYFTLNHVLCLTHKGGILRSQTPLATHLDVNPLKKSVIVAFVFACIIDFHLEVTNTNMHNNTISGGNSCWWIVFISGQNSNTKLNKLIKTRYT